MIFFFFSVFLEMRDRSSDYTQSSGGAVASGFAHEAFGGAPDVEALVFFGFCGLGGGAGASSVSASLSE